MSKSRREFLTEATLGLVGAAVVAGGGEVAAQQPGNLPPGAPSAFGTAPPVGPKVTPGTFAEAEKLVQVEMNDGDRAEAAWNWRNSLAPLYERRTGPR